MHDKPDRRHPHRMSAEAYAQPYCVVFLTIHAARSRSILCTDTCGPIIVECVKKGCEINGLDLIAYCLMPDHLHIVLMTEPGSDLQTYLRGFKWATSRKLRAAGVVDSIWQRSYWDRHHRDDEDVHNMIRYVMETPFGRVFAGSRMNGAFLNTSVCRSRSGPFSPLEGPGTTRPAVGRWWHQALKELI